ncbi:hypothetical protein IU453_27635 [Nocardia cyriacigeorgica]|uniref:hypothetical protein n=1 Tax=Nocardia cyriacigeorgica TaxID=135487 RepID=UPI001893932F|nr:hypothetical protein [Nocardia cyriacigeorgica]MBF6320521.1 hypothetical protein [Nocardia cyriacigeorgica]MBF6413233.1 hypothetical protein [Nocardia cyriacigeorgica]MBF6438006.1 hypothetical protein [Nocardia cyriacigeorgica]MBF6535008.1 hypothetical protein [Nocardia cyriacigeorgica]
MKRGFVTETHVVIYCDGCGDIYTGDIAEAICFDSVNEAVNYLNDHSPVLGWIYDGDRVFCDGCRAAARCESAGHSFPAPSRLFRSHRPIVCTVCGIHESETF